MCIRDRYGDAPVDLGSDQTAKGLYVLALINKFCAALNEMITGRYVRGGYGELTGGARIAYILNDIFKKTIVALDPFDILTDEAIRTAIRNASGISHALFLPEGAFENLIRQQIVRLLEPSLEASHLVFEELRRMVLTVKVPDLARYDVLSQRIAQVVDVVLQRCLIPTDQMIKSLIEIELGFVNTDHPDFVGATASLLAMTAEDEANASDRESVARARPIRQADGFKTDQEETKDKNTAAQLKKTKTAQPELLKEEDQKGNSIWSYIWGSSKKADELEVKLNSRVQKDKKLEQELENNELSMSRLHLFSTETYPKQFDLAFIQRNAEARVATRLQAPPKMIKVEGNPRQRERLEMELVKKLLVSYFDVVKKNINDSVPKTIITMLVNNARTMCERELVLSLYKGDALDELLSENAYIVKARETTRKQLVSLHKSLSILAEFESKY
eukprot:TRINITY_DN2821_c0_g1_i4.p1 TRINITY_DN2821_c0_g1~~TRINITY_DN2821_c0_g1_i4.p1  ORF type:complete len:446 (-),score=129.08 TRINITY_DN2821_c0_g1_i4:133-1470(-)